MTTRVEKVSNSGDYSDIIGDICGLGLGGDDNKEQAKEILADIDHATKQVEIQKELDSHIGCL